MVKIPWLMTTKRFHPILKSLQNLQHSWDQKETSVPEGFGRPEAQAVSLVLPSEDFQTNCCWEQSCRQPGKQCSSIRFHLSQLANPKGGRFRDGGGEKILYSKNFLVQTIARHSIHWVKKCLLAIGIMTAFRRYSRPLIRRDTFQISNFTPIASST